MRKILQLLLACSLMLLLLPSVVTAQERTITGTILSEENSTPLAGVTVRVKGTRRITQTDSQGKFSIQASNGETLQFSYVGFTLEEQVVGSNTTININLKPTVSTLGDVVITAYGITRTKKSLGYSTQVVAGEDIAETRRENFINALSGRVAGATITSTSGAPGASTQIVLRGATSMGGNNQPIFIVDGVPYDNQTMNQENLISGQSVTFANRNSDYGNRAGDINPADIESVTILKGPEATALYGSDGASGAIVITTKKGKSGRVGITYDNSFRFEKLYRFPEVQTTYGIGRNGVYDPAANANPFSIVGTAAGSGIPAAFGARIPAGTPVYDNVSSFFKTGFTQNHNITVDGGNETATYRLSGNFVNQDGIIPNTAFKKVSFKMAGSTKFGILKINSSINYVNTITDKATKGAGGYLLTLLTWPVTNDIKRFSNPDGTKIPIRNISNFALEYDNPLWDVNKNPAQDKMDRLTGNLTLSADITKWLNLSAISGIDYYTQHGYLATHPLSRFGVASNGFYSLYEQTTKNFSNTLRVLINKKLGSFSNTFTAGFYFEDNNTKLESQKGERFYERDFLSINNTDPLSRDAKSTVTETRKVRFFGNYIVGFKDILYLSLAGSREGLSTFMSKVVRKNPFFNYGSASLSFSATDIASVKQALPWLSLAKARVSYASTGKGPYMPYVIDYLFSSQISTGGGYAYGFTGNNFDLEPERSNNLEYGVEFAAFSNRVKLDVTAYSLRSKKQLIAARASYGTGFVIKWFNGGELENKGIEIQLGLTPIKNKLFSWESLFNFDRNVGTVISMPADLPTYYDSDTWVFGNLRSQYFKGAEIGNLAAHTFRKNNAGQLLISTTTGLPIKDETFITVGDRQPDFKLGWVNTLTYRNLSLSFNLDFRKGGDVFNATEYLLYLTGYSTRTVNRETPRVIDGVLLDGLENSATPTRNTIAITPMFNSEFYASTVATAEEDFLEEVNWMRLRDVTLRYRLPSKFLQRQKFIKSASVFFTGTDLFMKTNYSGADPSVNANTSFSRGYGGAGIDYGAISVPRGYNFGLQIQL